MNCSWDHPAQHIRVGSLYLQKEDVRKIDQKLNYFLTTEMSYLKHGYTLKELAEKIDIPLHHLSAFINQHYGMNFNDFINQYRVIHSIKKIINGEWKYKTLEAIAEESGFNNRNTFRMAFKKVTGISPSEYLKSTGRSR
jgi:AraC-like DNA-binding protein